MLLFSMNTPDYIQARWPSFRMAGTREMMPLIGLRRWNWRLVSSITASTPKDFIDCHQLPHSCANECRLDVWCSKKLAKLQASDRLSLSP